MDAATVMSLSGPLRTLKMHFKPRHVERRTNQIYNSKIPHSVLREPELCWLPNIFYRLYEPGSELMCARKHLIF